MINVPWRTRPHKLKAATAIIGALLLLAAITMTASASPLQISGVSAVNITDTSATITWNTDESGNSTVNYGKTVALGSTLSDGAFVQNHALNLMALTPSTLYYYEVISTNEAGNETITDNNHGAYYTFTTSPTISDVQATDIDMHTATISWSTDVAASSVVNYGNTTELSLTASDSSLVTSHSLALGELTRQTIYYYEVSSTNAEGNTVIDNNGGAYYTFETDDFMTALTEPIGPFLATALSATSNILDNLVDLNASQPVTGSGWQVLDIFSKFITGLTKIVATIVVFKL